MPVEPVACYRHPKREAPLRCTRCERPICIEDAVDAPVGFLCPDDAKQSTRVRRAHATASGSRPVTSTLLGLIIVAFIVQQVPDLGRQVQLDLGTWGFGVAAGEWWRVVTGGFVHFGIIHVAFNGYMLWALGGQLEGVLGRRAFGALFAAGLAGGSVGALALSYSALTGGASGAVFGLIGAGLLLQRQQGISPMQSNLGQLLLFNIIFTFLPGFNVSIGGHLGGLLGGSLALLLLGSPTTSRANAWRAGLLALGLFAAAIAVGELGPFV